MAAHVYVANRSMVDDYFFNADGELLVVPQVGRLALRHRVRPSSSSRPGEIAVLPRGVNFKVELVDGRSARLCLRELRRQVHPARPRPDRRQLPGQPARLQDALRRFEEKETPCRLTVKWCGNFHVTEIGHSPLDVVAWHGNYAPYKYDLATLFAGRRPAVRPSRSVDLHGADRAVRRGGHRQHRLRHLPASAGWWPRYVPAALVPPEHHVGVHGPDLRRSTTPRRKASCPAASACTTDAGRTGPTRLASKRPRARS